MRQCLLESRIFFRPHVQELDLIIKYKNISLYALLMTNAFIDMQIYYLG